MSRNLPPPEKSRLELGYVRLTDSAPLVAAAELGLFERFQLDVRLSQEVSWANVRDKLAIGALDAAHMLAPLPAMTTLGVSGIRLPMLTGLTLSRNGNTITLAEPLWHQVRMRCQGGFGPTETARAFASVVTGGMVEKPTLAVVHPFSTHAILLRRWLTVGGLEPDRDVRTIIVPPAQMVDSLANGLIDGYCVGEPWGSVAVHHGIGAIAALGSRVWPDSPEKVLCVTEPWHEHHPATHLRLRLALMEACRWLAEPGNRATAAAMLASPRYLDLPEEWLAPSLTGTLRLEPRGEPVSIPDFHVFGAEMAGFPWRSDAEALIAACGELLGRGLTADKAASLAQHTSRPDLFRAAARELGIETPIRDSLRPVTAPARRTGRNR